MKITMKKAKEAAVKLLGSAKGLEKDPDVQDWYFIRMGDFTICIRPYETETGVPRDLIKISISGPMGVSFGLYNFDTLEENYIEEENCRKTEKQTAEEEWLQRFDTAEDAKEYVDKLFA